MSLTGMAITAEMAEKWGLVNHIVERSEVLKKAKQIAEAIIKNNQGMVLRYKSVINDGFKLDLANGLTLEKVSSSHCFMLYFYFHITHVFLYRNDSQAPKSLDMFAITP